MCIINFYLLTYLLSYDGCLVSAYTHTEEAWTATDTTSLAAVDKRGKRVAIVKNSAGCRRLLPAS